MHRSAFNQRRPFTSSEMPKAGGEHVGIVKATHLAGLRTNGMVPQQRRLHLDTVRCQAPKGFGASKSKGGKPATRRAGLPTLTPPSKKKGGVVLPESEWIPIAKESDFGAKDVIPVVLKDKTTVVLYRVGKEVFCSDANSTAYKYPLVDAKIFDRNGQPAIEVPFDGTTYNLRNGEVLEWCPKNNPLRIVLGALKEREGGQNLKVYPVRQGPDGTITVKFVS